ncbi:DUF3168 domain-containing protein [Bradyrhizobium yuanmingense]|uniref:tail completion protein gp17 n=1 Tax=Bradyrhizobium yuanmingense TaxID=108015 RepID=UPI000FE2D75E|nr:DUF3168 domain-containing protein [Bradyrhizobium yuanmingense]TGN89418.1 DUF3168 domain-containing protein [Bradyrhizobium yuanmingense]
MKDLRPALRAFLLSDMAIASVVDGARVYPQRMPQGEAGASVVYTRVSGEGDYTMQGPSGFVRTRFQIDAWASTADAATVLANLIKDRLDGYRGVMGEDADAITVHGVFIAAEREDFDEAAKLHRSGRDYIIHHIEL